MTVVTCAHRDFFGRVPPGLPDTTQLLTLRNISLVHLANNSFVSADVADLEELVIELNNELTMLGWEAFAPLGASLQRLKIRNNAQLSSLEPGALAMLPQLEQLEISSCPLLRVLPDNLFGAASPSAEALKSLSLADNGLNSWSPAAVTGLDNVRRLDLSGNELQSLPSPAFATLPALEVLVLDDNSISRLTPTSMAHPVLKWLSMKHNQMTQIASGTSWTNNDALETLILSNNELSAFPANAILPALVTLDLTGNVIATVRSRWWNDLPALKNLILNDNRISAVNNAEFQTPAPNELDVLELKGNRLTSVSSALADFLEAQPSIRFLLLGSNTIKSSDVLELSPLVLLQVLDLSENQLTSVSSPMFPFPELTALYLHSNPISQFVGNVFLNNPALRILTLYDLESMRSSFFTKTTFSSLRYPNSIFLTAPAQQQRRRALDSLVLGSCCAAIWMQGDSRFSGLEAVYCHLPSSEMVLLSAVDPDTACVCLSSDEQAALAQAHNQSESVLAQQQNEVLTAQDLIALLESSQTLSGPGCPEALVGSPMFQPSVGSCSARPSCHPNCLTLSGSPALEDDETLEYWIAQAEERHNAITATQCPSGWFLSPPSSSETFNCLQQYVYVGSNGDVTPLMQAPATYSTGVATCAPCAKENCARCDPEDAGETCLVCATGTFFSNGECISNCPTGFIRSGDVNPRCVCDGGLYSLGTTCVSSCPFGFVTDSAARTCEPCSSGTYFLDGSCANACPAGYQAVASAVPTCECQNGFWFSDKVCVDSCPWGYRQVSGTHPKCETCAAGTYFNPLNGLCVSACSTTFVAYDGSVPTCECSPGRYFVESDRACVLTCPEGLVSIGGSHPRCEACSDELILFGDECVVQCTNGFSEVSGPPRTCECINGFLHQGACLVSCPVTFRASQGECVACPADGHCLTCDASNCLSCDADSAYPDLVMTASGVEVCGVQSSTANNSTSTDRNFTSSSSSSYSWLYILIPLLLLLLLLLLFCCYTNNCCCFGRRNRHKQITPTPGRQGSRLSMAVMYDRDAEMQRYGQRGDSRASLGHPRGYHQDSLRYSESESGV